MSGGSRDESVRARYRSVAGTLRERPWTLGVGWLVAIPTVVAFGVGFGLYAWAMEAVLPHLLLAVGLAGIRESVFARSIVAPDVVIQVARGGFGLVGLLLVVEGVRAIVVAPATAAVYRIADEGRNGGDADEGRNGGDADEGRNGGETDPRRVARELVGSWRGLLGGLAVRLAGFVAFCLLLPVAVATFLALGTALEAVAWELALSYSARLWILVFSLVVGLVLARRIATAAVWRADPDAMLDPEVGGLTAIRRSLAAFRAAPRRALVDDAAASAPVVAVLVALLAVVAAGGALDAGPALLLVLAPVAVFGLATALPASALYRTETAAAPDRSTDDGAPASGRLSIGTVAVVLLLVVALGAGGGWARAADVGLGSDDPAATISEPGTADPGVVVARSLDAVGRTSVTTERAIDARTVYPDNGTSESWFRGQLWTARSEPHDDERVVVWSYANRDEPREWRGEGVYRGETAAARASVDYRADAPDQARVLDASWWSVPTRPTPVPAGRLVTFNANGTVEDGEWRVVERTDDRIVYGTTNSSMVTRFTDVYRLQDGRVRVEIDRSTGRIRRVEARAARSADADDDPGYWEKRVTVTVGDYGDTEVRRPPGTAKGPLEHLLDVLFYRPQ